MDASARLWIRPFPPIDPDTPEVILAVDHASADPAERMVCALLGRGHEGREGVFHLLADDLSARYLRTGDRLAVTLLAPRHVVAADVADRTDGLRDHLDALPRDPLDPGRVVLLHRETVTDFVPGAEGDERQPVLLLDHVGGSTGPAELADLFENGEASVAVVPATEHPTP
ncbi:hypothetical protein ABZ615_33290 [Streptomyces sp. NPDC007325]|uniref:hypothetical protein n=1 Tax=Streptomyces sp. NPDC007325 TaxID=3154588 RepID=UPI00340507E5